MRSRCQRVTNRSLSTMIRQTMSVGRGRYRDSRPCFRIEYLSETVVNRILVMTPHYRIDRDGETGGTFWMNHCEHCGGQMIEEALHGEPEGAFGATPQEGPEAIQWHEVREPFEAWAGVESHDVKPLDS